MLPGLDGIGVVRALREAGVKAPVLFLTALGGVGDRVRGLEAGGDDYLVKPFAFAELVARVNALARRPPLSDTPVVLRVADLEMNLLKRTVTRAGKAVELQPREFQLLEFLMRNADRVVTRTMLLEAVWDFHFDPKTNIVETHISRLRSKLSQHGGPELIHTVRGAGYMLRAATSARVRRLVLPRLLRVASFRFAALYVAFFAVSALVLGMTVFPEARSALQQQMTARIENEVGLLTEEYHADGLATLIDGIGQRVRGARALEYLLEKPAGAYLAGNMPAMTD